MFPKNILIFGFLVSLGLAFNPADLLADDGFQYPLSVAAAADGTVYVADRKLPGIWKVTAGKAEVYFAADKKFRTPLNAVRCLAVDGKGRLLAGDSGTREVYRFDAAGKPTALTDGGIGIAMGIAVAADGEIYVSDLETHRIWKIPAKGGKPSKFAEIPSPHGMTIDAKGQLWVVSHGPSQLFRLSADGKAEAVVTERTFRYPHDVVVDSKGVVYVSDGYAKGIWKIDESGKPSQWVNGTPFVNPVGLALQGETVLVADSRAKQVFQVDAAGSVKPLVAPVQE